MSNESDDKVVRQLLLKAIACLELAVELSEAKVTEPKKPSLLLSKIARQKLAEIEARQHQQPQDSL